MPCAARRSRVPHPHLSRPCNVSDTFDVLDSARSPSRRSPCSQPISVARFPELLLGPRYRLNRAIAKKAHTISRQSSSVLQELGCSDPSPGQISHLYPERLLSLSMITKIRVAPIYLQLDSTSLTKLSEGGAPTSDYCDPSSPKLFTTALHFARSERIYFRISSIGAVLTGNKPMAESLSWKTFCPVMLFISA